MIPYVPAILLICHEAEFSPKDLPFSIIAIQYNNAGKTIWQSAKDKDEICRRANTRQRFLTQYFTL